MTQSLDSAKEAALQTHESRRQSFHALLRHAWQRSSFYRDLYSSLGITESKLPEVTVKDLPIIDKKLLMENFDRAVTDPRLKKADLERWMQEHRNPAENYLQDFIVVHSSGSSGTQGIFACHRADWQIAASAMAGRLPLPANYPGGRTRAAFYLASHGNFGGVSTAARLPKSIYESLILSMLDSHEHVARQLNDFQPHQLHGYSSGVHDLSRLAMRGKLKISPVRIFVGGDKLTENMERDIRYAWDVAIHDIYTATECKYIAMRQAGEDDMAIIEELNILEVLDDANRPVTENQEGRVVLTNLYDYALPIMRYELGDYVTLGKTNADSVPATINNIRGRTNDALPVTLGDGTRDTLNPIALVSFYVPGLEKLQYVSLRSDLVRIDYEGMGDLDAVIRTEFQRVLDLKGAPKTTFEIRRVARLANDPRTGKFHLVKTQHDRKADGIDVHGDLTQAENGVPGEQDLSNSLTQPVSKQSGRTAPAQTERTSRKDETAQQPVRAEQGRIEAEETSRGNRWVASPHPNQDSIRAKCFHSSGAFVEFPKEEVEQSIPERFEKSVRKNPQGIAVKAADHVVTYAELNAMANRVAHAIVRQRGSEAEPIAVLLEKGLEQIVAILGALKAGKFFALLDPSFPAARNADMLADLRPGIVITHQDSVSSMGKNERNQYRFLEIEACDVETADTDLEILIAPSERAAILYTSGSTGEPKGVIQSHRNVLHNMMLRTNTFGVCERDKLSVLASGTPNAVMNTFLGLLNGATLVLFDVKKEGTTRLVGWFLREKISICWTTAPLFRQLCETLNGDEEFLDLRHVILASDQASRADFDLFKEHFPVNTVLSNALTGSETGLLRTFMMDHETEILGNDLPVGYRVEDKETLLLDDRGKRVDFNEVGEIVVSSEYLSPGYWRRPDLTEAKFKPDPNGGDRRLYFTGDLGLMLPDGCLVHKGRKDFRVKIRGYGVEIAEVEKALHEHLLIRETVIVARRNESTEARLVAYFVASSQDGPSVSELRGFLSKKLPDYMIPSTFVKLDVMPLSPAGKVDRSALPDPDNCRPELDTPFVMSRTPVEKDLAAIWAEVLFLDRVGMNDNFFDLGGHSLAATQIASRVLKQFELEIPVRSFFASPTVAEMAAVIAESQAKKISEPELERILIEVESYPEAKAKQFLAEATRINSSSEPEE